MGNCQAIDNATLIVQQPCGRADKYYWPVSAYEIMKMNPGHSVALLLTTTTTTTHRPPTTTTTTPAATPATSNISSVRVTRIKLLRPTDTLILGQVYRLITTQEVMRGLCAKKYAKTKKINSSEPAVSSDDDDKKKEGLKEKIGSEFDALPRKPEMENKANQVLKHDRHKPRAKPTAANSKSWQPSLRSISEAGS